MKVLAKKLVRFIKKYRYFLLILMTGLCIGYYFCLPSKLFNKPCSTVLFDQEMQLLSAQIASDGQWRFPPTDSLPEKYVQALLCYEDKRFYRHWGVDLWALGRALRSNFSKAKRVSGASTLTMQTIRLSRDNPPRTMLEKVWEMILATRMEWGYSKDEILRMYASNAPFGGNVVGIDAAAWKYFQRPAHKISWAEAAMLAVLPNSPSLIHISKNRSKLLKKRNRLLDKLQERNLIDSLNCALSKLEPLPEKPGPLPRLAPHLLSRVQQEQATTQTGIIETTIQKNLQFQLNKLISRHSGQLQKNQINNAAALIVEIQTGDVMAYVGNAPNAPRNEGADVDIIPAERSSGSIIKPILMAASIQDAVALEHHLLPDIPSQFGTYTPKNYDRTYAGAVPMSQVIARSLNIPSIHLLQKYGMTRFHHKLQQLGMKTLHYSAEHYGLTLILGGAEVSIWDLGAIYAGMARNLANYNHYNGLYDPNNFRPLNYLAQKTYHRLSGQSPALVQHSPLQAAAIYQTFEAMQEVGRPGAEGYWQSFVSSSKIAWKTGTSYGFRDAWAVGISDRHVVVVWAGNADGEGRPGLIGLTAAGPILFDIFHLLGPTRNWFEMPLDEMVEAEICTASGQLANSNCPEKTKTWIPIQGERTPNCPYHKVLLLNKTQNYQVHDNCYPIQEMQRQTFFQLPPTQEWYYMKQHPSYQKPPPFHPNCLEAMSEEPKSMELIYPLPNMQILIPKNLAGEKSRVVFEAAHSHPKAQIYWHLDNNYIGSTRELHQIELYTQVGKHQLTLVDEDGQRISRTFEILSD